MAEGVKTKYLEVCNTCAEGVSSSGDGTTGIYGSAPGVYGCQNYFNTDTLTSTKLVMCKSVCVRPQLPPQYNPVVSVCTIAAKRGACGLVACGRLFRHFLFASVPYFTDPDSCSIMKFLQDKGGPYGGQGCYAGCDFAETVAAAAGLTAAAAGAKTTAATTITSSPIAFAAAVVVAAAMAR